MKKKEIIVALLLITVIVVLWKIVYRNGYAKKDKENSFLSIDGTYYMVPQWQDSWPLNS